MTRARPVAAVCAMVIAAAAANAQIPVPMNAPPMTLREVTTIAASSGWSVAVAELAQRCFYGGIPDVRDMSDAGVPAARRPQLASTCVRSAEVQVSADIDGVEANINGRWHALPVTLWVQPSAEFALLLNLRAAVPLRATEVTLRGIFPRSTSFAQLNLEPMATVPTAPRLWNVVPERRGELGSVSRPVFPPDLTPRNGWKFVWGGLAMAAIAHAARGGDKAMCFDTVRVRGYVNGSTVNPGDTYRNPQKCGQIQAKYAGIGVGSGVVYFSITELARRMAHGGAVASVQDSIRKIIDPERDADRWCNVHCTAQQFQRWTEATMAYSSQLREVSSRNRELASREVVSQGRFTSTVAWTPGGNTLSGPGPQALAYRTVPCPNGSGVGRGVGLIIVPAPVRLPPLQSEDGDVAALTEAFCSVVAEVVIAGSADSYVYDRLFAPDSGDLARHMRGLSADAPILVAAVGHGLTADSTVFQPLHDWIPERSDRRMELFDLTERVLSVTGRDRRVIVAFMGCYGLANASRRVAGDGPSIHIGLREPGAASRATVIVASMGDRAESHIDNANRQYAVAALANALRGDGDTDGDGRLSVGELQRLFSRQVTDRVQMERGARQQVGIYPTRQAGAVVFELHPTGNKE